MINAKRWRWALVVGLPVMVGGALAFGGVVRLVFEGEARLSLSGDAAQVNRDLTLFRSDETRKRLSLAMLHPTAPVRYAKVPGHPLDISLRAEASWPKDVAQLLTAAGKISVDQAFAAQKAALHKELAALEKERSNLKVVVDQIALEKKTLSAGSKRLTPRVDAAEKIQALKTRRQFLIDHYPTHTDIQILAKQIKDLQNNGSRRPSRSGLTPGKVSEFARRTNEAGVRLHYYFRRIEELSRAEKALKPAWHMVRPVQISPHPARVEGWPLCAGILIAVFILAYVVFRGESEAQVPESANGLWRPDAVKLEIVPVEAPAVPAPVTEETLPSDPLIAQAAALYDQWIDVAKLLYTPAPEAPQGVLDRVGPLLQESSDFLPKGHDVLARYLARTVAPGDLPAHVARTVLMTLTGAQDAGVTPEHRLAMALAALFHDLAVVPRPQALQEEVGSEVGRLSAGVLRRIPGLAPALLSMVEEILIGMDEFKLETWQNVASGQNLEPLSKVLREIDRFEKVMQKQRSRLDRQLTHRKAV